jgi:hypothetical protein
MHISTRVSGLRFMISLNSVNCIIAKYFYLMEMEMTLTTRVKYARGWMRISRFGIARVAKTAFVDK